MDAGAIDWSDPRAAAFRDAMNDDFNTPGALAVLFEMASDLNRSGSVATASLLRALGATLGVLQQSPQAFLQAGAALDRGRHPGPHRGPRAGQEGQGFREPPTAFATNSRRWASRSRTAPKAPPG